MQVLFLDCGQVYYLLILGMKAQQVSLKTHLQTK